MKTEGPIELILVIFFLDFWTHEQSYIFHHFREKWSMRSIKAIFLKLTFSLKTPQHSSMWFFFENLTDTYFDLQRYVDFNISNWRGMRFYQSDWSEIYKLSIKQPRSLYICFDNLKNAAKNFLRFPEILIFIMGEVCASTKAIDVKFTGCLWNT